MTREEELKLKAKARLRLKQRGGEASIPKTPTGFVEPEIPAAPLDFRSRLEAGRATNPDAYRAKGFSDIDTSVPKDLVNVFGEGYTWGTGNRLSGGMNAVKEGEAAKERLGGMALPVEVAGAVASPTILARGPLMAYRGLKTGLHALEGGAAAAADAWAKDQSWGDVGKAAMQGAGLSGIVSKIAEPFANKFHRDANIRNQEYKTAAEQKAGYKKKYKEVADTGGVYQNADLRNLAAEVKNIKLTKGIDDRAIYLRNRLLSDWKNKDINPEELDKLRRWVRIKMKSAQPSDAQLGEEFVSAMDKFTNKTDVVKPSITGIGPPQKVPGVNDTLKSARVDVAGHERGKLYKRAVDVAARGNRSKRMNPFGPSLESARVTEIAKLNQKIEDGKIKSKIPAVEKKALDQLEAGTFRRNTGGFAEHLAPSGKLGKYLAVAGQLTHALPGGSAVGVPALLASGAFEGAHQFGQKATKTEIEDLLAFSRDATGKGIKADPKQIERARLLLAKALAGTQRAATDDEERR